MQHLPAIGFGNGVRHVLAGQHGDGLGGRDLHFLVDLAGTHIKRAAEDIGEAQDIVHLVRIVRTAGGDDRVGTDFLGIFRHDFRHRVGHGEDDRSLCHGFHHFRRYRTGNRQAEKDVRTDKRVLQRAGIRLDRMRRLPLVHRCLAALIDHAGTVDENDVLMRHAHAFEKLHAGDGGGAGAVRHHPDVRNVASGQVKRIDQACRRDDGGAVLVVMEDRNLEALAKLLLDDETFRRLDILEIDAAEARRKHGHGLDEFLGVLRIDLEIEPVDIGELLEQDGLALHHRLRRGGADIAKAENGRAVRDHRDHIPLGRVVIGRIGVRLDGKAGRRDPRGIGQRQVVLAHQRLGCCDFQLARAAIGVECQGFLVKL